MGMANTNTKVAPAICSGSVEEILSRLLRLFSAINDEDLCAPWQVTGSCALSKLFTFSQDLDSLRTFAYQFVEDITSMASQASR